jgi:serine/threonine protein kinase
MVFEYMDFDLSSLLSSKQMVPLISPLLALLDLLISLSLSLQIFSPSHVRCYAKQLFSGLHYMHRNNILHRDIKGEPSPFLSLPPLLLLN